MKKCSVTKGLESRDFIQLVVKAGDNPMDHDGLIDKIIAAVKKHEKSYNLSRITLVINTRDYFVEKLMQQGESSAKGFNYKGFAFKLRIDKSMRLSQDIFVLF